MVIEKRCFFFVSLFEMRQKAGLSSQITQMQTVHLDRAVKTFPPGCLDGDSLFYSYLLSKLPFLYAFILSGFSHGVLGVIGGGPRVEE